MKKSIKKLVALASAGLMAVTLAITAVPTNASADCSDAGIAAGKAAFDPNGTYHAYFGIQQDTTWIFRDEWTSPTLGIDGENLVAAGLKFDQGCLFGNDEDGNTIAIEGPVVKDAEIVGNGTYTIGVYDLNGKLTENPDAVVKMIYCNTDIPKSALDDGTVTITDWNLKIDDSSQALPEEIFYPAEYNDESGLIRFDPCNLYQKDQGAYDACPEVPNPYNYAEISFTISGFANDKPADEPASDAASTTTSTTTDSSESAKTNPAPIAIAVVVIAVVVAVVIVVVTKKKED